MMLKNYWKSAVRKIGRHRALSLIKLCGLCMGICVCMILYVFVRYELSFDRFHRQAAQIYRVVQHTQFAGETQHWSSTAYPLAEALRQDFSNLRLVTQTAGPVSRNFSLTDADRQLDMFEEDLLLFVDLFFPQVFDLQWLQGNPKEAFTHPDAAVLTESLAVKIFGREKLDKGQIPGKVLQLNSTDALQITGIVADPPANSSIRFRMLVPYAFYKLHNPYFAGNWSGNYQGTTYVMPEADTDTGMLEQQINAWKAKYMSETDQQRIRYGLQPLTDMHTNTLYSSSIQSYTMPLKFIRSSIWIGLFILVIACINFTNLAVAQASGQAREVAVRKVLGGSRLQLFGQYMSENSLLIGLAMLLSLLLTHISLGYLNSLLSFLQLELTVSFDLLGFGLLLALCISLFSAAYPAFVTASFEPAAALKNKVKAAHSRGFGLRKSLIIVQFTLVLILGIGTLVVHQQVQLFSTADLGFTREAVVNTYIPDEQKAETFRQQLLSQTAIQEVTLATGAPTATDVRNGTSFRLPHQAETAAQEAEMKSIDTHYLDFYQLSLIAGRNFTRTADPFDEFIVNERLLRSLGMTPEEALGQTLQINEGKASIVGVVADYHNNALQEDITPAILINWKANIFEAAVKLPEAQNMSASLAQLKETWERVFPNHIFRTAFLDEQLALNYQMEQLIFRGFITFAALAMLIACLGLVGMTTFTLAQRTIEIGVRKVLGASVQQLFTTLSSQYVQLLLIALVIAVPVANYFLEEWLSGFAYRIRIRWWVYALPAVLTFITALLVISRQTLKAASKNPVDSLRYE